MSVRIGRDILSTFFTIDRDSVEEQLAAGERMIYRAIDRMPEEQVRDLIAKLKPIIRERIRQSILSELPQIPAAELLDYLQSAAHELFRIEVELHQAEAKC